MIFLDLTHVPPVTQSETKYVVTALGFLGGCGAGEWIALFVPDGHVLAIPLIAAQF
jgi:hypothetical protein